MPGGPNSLLYFVRGCVRDVKMKWSGREDLNLRPQRPECYAFTW
jgi:hypothetical protein